MSGFAFASIYKDPTPAPGPGPGPTPAPTPGPEPEPPVTYTISGESIMPFVPFTVTVTGSSNRAKGDGGNLQADINYEILDGGDWNGGKSEWELGTRVCDSKRTNAKFSWLIRGKDPVTATLAYDAGTMTPNITDASVVLGKTFGFTITFSGGENCYATSLSSFGASYWWEAFKDGKWEKTTKIVVRQSSFSEGVLTGTGYVGNLAGYEKVRLCVDYAGRDTAYDEATIAVSAVTITLGDDTLHCWGASTSLKIESDSLAAMTAAFYRGDNPTEDITNTNGNPIAFNFTGTSWTGNIQAATGATAGTVVLKVMYNGVVQATQEITVETAVYGNLVVSTNSIIQGDSFTMSGAVASLIGEISRIPENAFKLVAIQDGNPLAQINNTAGSQSVEYGSVTPSNYGTVYVRIIDNRDDSIIMEEEVAVQSVYEALAEAINERNKAKGNPTAYTGSEGAGTLAGYARNAMFDYIKESATDYTTNDIVWYKSSPDNTEVDTSLPTGKTEAEWMRDTYNKVCSTIRKRISSNGSLTRKSWRKEASHVENQTNLGSGNYEDISDTIARAKSACRQNWPSNFTEYNNVNQSICGYASINIDSHQVTTILRQNKIQLKLDTLPTVACKVYIYSGIGKYNSDTTFSKMDANIADENKYSVIGQYEQGTTELVDSPIVTDADVSFSNNSTSSSSAYGFQGGNLPVILEYHFKHQ